MWTHGFVFAAQRVGKRSLFFESPGEKGGSFVEDLLRNYLKINGDNGDIP